jgi:arsenical pump membrane protein
LLSTVLIWAIAAAAIGAILFRLKEWPEAVWACLGAALLVVFRLIPASQAIHAVSKGTDVYLFLTGMMLTADLARREGVFDWLASIAVAHARGSGVRLFTLIFSVGILVTVFLSNDATAVVLTPAVYAAVKKARTNALPHLFACAFIANAASFVLPISNPANLVVYGSEMPALAAWLRLFILPSLLSIGATYLVLKLMFRADLRCLVAEDVAQETLSSEGRRAAWGILAMGAVLIGASAFGRDLGLPACVAALCAVLWTTRARFRSVLELVREIPWSVLPLVAGLFVIVEALNRAGALAQLDRGLRALLTMPSTAAALSASFGIALLSNIMNNLPSGLLVGGALHSLHVPGYLRHALLLGVDLGPNLSVTGSLATILWLIVLRREGLDVSGVRFLKAGVLVMPPALLLATAALAFTAGN